MFQLMESSPQSAVIKVIGVGGGGSNAVQHMVNAKENTIEGVDFIVANTDVQALQNANADTILQLGAMITKGLGAGANPEVGKQSAIEDIERIREVLDGADMVFITAGMGGGTGTGAAPIIAEIAKEMGILTVAVVTRPFKLEGKKRGNQADSGISELRCHVDSLITIPNQKLLDVLGKVSLLQAFEAANSVLHGAVQGIAELITRPGLINVDFADVRTVMSEMGMAIMGTGSATGDDRAMKAAKAAIESPLLEDIDKRGARGVLVNITAGESLSMDEFQTVHDCIEEFVSDSANVVVGTVIDESLNDELRVTVVLTGLGSPEEPKAPTLVENKKSDGTPDYKKLVETPTITRNNAVANKAKVPEPVEDMDYLDIPAFLRRQEEVS